jgi:hypothetical protein
MRERAVLVRAARRAVEEQAARLAVRGVVFHLCFHPIRGDKHLELLLPRPSFLVFAVPAATTLLGVLKSLDGRLDVVQL